MSVVKKQTENIKRTERALRALLRETSLATSVARQAREDCGKRLQFFHK
jgi:hypothetical protein